MKAWSPFLSLCSFSLLSATYIVGQFLNASWESVRVCLQAALSIARVGGPAVIDADVLITCLFPSLLHHHICHLHVESLAAEERGPVRHKRFIWNIKARKTRSRLG